MTDIIGNAIHRFHFLSDDEPIKVWIDKKRDADMKPSHFFRTWREMSDIEKSALRRCRGKVLDVGAAAGCHSIYLQQKKLNVMAVESSLLSCSVMMDREIKNVINRKIEKLSGQKFDTILLLMNGLGMGQHTNGTVELLKHLKSLLNKGGQILGDSTDIFYRIKRLDGATEIDLSKYYGEVTYSLEHKGKKGKPFQWIFIDFSLLSLLANEAGLKTELLKEDGSHSYLARLF